MARPRKQTYTMAQYLDNINNDYISNDADTQRNPAWKPIVDGLAVTILTDDYVPVIILAEEDSGQIHIVDGGSRTAAFKMIRYGNYKIKSSVENPIIQYKKMSKNEQGKTIWEDVEFDIRNKTFEQFPKELQKKFDEYQVDTVIHEHCNKEKIAMYIKRYNDHKAMSANQKMFVYLPKFAEKIRDITNKQFFINYCDINDNDKEKGILERIIAESIMCMFHIDKWNKNGKKLATYLNENANEEEFDTLYNNIKRLESIVTEDTKVLFNSKDCFIWFTLFNKFTSYGLDDSMFGEFLLEFINSLKNKIVDGKLFYTADVSRSTKDKSVIVDKLYILESLMKEFFHIEENKEKQVNVESFIAENLDLDVETVKEDMDLYNESLDTLLEGTVKLDSKLRNKENRPSLLAMMTYSYKNDVDLDEWLVDYAAKNNIYLVDQKKNFNVMLESFKNFIEKGKVA